jgi:uncharacterized phiE125 gp8 family phage protein
MNVTTPTPASGTDVISLANMKEFLRVDHSDEDTTITALLDAAVSHVSDYTNRHIGTAASAIFYLERWRPAALAYGPVVSITNVTYNDTSGTLQTLDTSKYYVQTHKDDTCLIFFHDTPDLQDYNAMPIRITASVGGQPSNSIKHAVRMLVAHWYENRRAVITGPTATTIPLGVHSLLNTERIIDTRQ